MKKILIVLLVVSLVLFSACSPSVEGRYENKEKGIIFELKENRARRISKLGDFGTTESEGTYQVSEDGKNITVRIEYGILDDDVYNGVIKGNKIIFTMSEFWEDELVFVKI